LTPKQAQENLLAWVQSLMSQGYTIHDIKSMRLSDFDLMVQALEIKLPLIRPFHSFLVRKESKWQVILVN